MELPWLFKVRTLPKSAKASKRSKCWRPSRQEVLDAVCLHVTVSFANFFLKYLIEFCYYDTNLKLCLLQELAEIKERIDDRKKTLEKFKFPLQAVPVFLGPLNAIRQCFIVIDNQRWEVESPYQAIEAFFQLSFGLGSEYPAEARHIWLFLQQTLFNIKTNLDYVKDTGLSSFIASRVKDYELFSAPSAQ